MDRSKEQIVYLIFGSLLLALTIGLFLALGMGFDFLHGDPGEYIEDSLEWTRPFDLYHVPLFSLLIALVKGVTFGWIDYHSVMLLVTLPAFVACLVGTYLLVGGGQKGLLASGSFALWPFIGLVYVVYPIADVLAMGLFLWGWYFVQREDKNYLVGGVLLGLALITHKVIWIFVPGLLVGQFLQARDWRILLSSGISLLPLLLLWISGSVFYSDPGWLLSSNLDLEVQSPSYLSVLDGLLGPLLFGGWSDRVRGLTVFGIFLLSLLVGLWGVKERNWIAVGIAGSVIFLCLTLDEGVIWSVVRFGRLLVIPLVWILGTTVVGFLRKGPVQRLVGISVGLVLLLSQFAFAYHMALDQRIG